MLVGLRPVDCRAIDRAAGSRAGQQREPEHQEPRPAALAPQERLPRLLCLVVLHQFSPTLWCLGGMVGPSWLTKRDRTGGPDGPRAGLALALGGLYSFYRAHTAALPGTPATRARQAKGKGPGRGGRSP